MSRISHDTPMKAFDHIANLLKDAGGKDGRISRDDASKLVSKLEKEGRGTEALAAKNLFTMIDKRDQGAGNTVTGIDIQGSRSFVESKMLRNRDTNSNGYSAAEVAKMSTTGRALVELGQVLSIAKTGGRISHATPERGLNHVAGLLRTAAGADGVTSRADAAGLAKELAGAGRGTEALAVETFFSFVDHRDSGAGARVTDADLTKAVGYAKEKLLKNKDANNNGYSAADVAKFSKSAKSFLLLGQMIDTGIIKSAE